MTSTMIEADNVRREVIEVAEAMLKAIEAEGTFDRNKAVAHVRALLKIMDPEGFELIELEKTTG